MVAALRREKVADGSGEACAVDHVFQDAAAHHSEDVLGAHLQLLRAVAQG